MAGGRGDSVKGRGPDGQRQISRVGDEPRNEAQPIRGRELLVEGIIKLYN